MAGRVHLNEQHDIGGVVIVILRTFWPYEVSELEGLDRTHIFAEILWDEASSFRHSNEHTTGGVRLNEFDDTDILTLRTFSPYEVPELEGLEWTLLLSEIQLDDDSSLLHQIEHTAGHVPKFLSFWTFWIGTTGNDTSSRWNFTQMKFRPYGV